MPQLLQQILAELRRLNDGKEAKVREIMSISETAEYLGMAEGTLRDWVRMRRVPFSKINGTIKFRRSKLTAWVDLHEIAVREE